MLPRFVRQFVCEGSYMRKLVSFAFALRTEWGRVRHPARSGLASRGRRQLRFDCFDNRPHYHYGPENKFVELIGRWEGERRDLNPRPLEPQSKTDWDEAAVEKQAHPKIFLGEAASCFPLHSPVLL